jgi:hypothetical protein
MLDIVDNSRRARVINDGCKCNYTTVLRLMIISIRVFEVFLTLVVIWSGIRGFWVVFERLLQSCQASCKSYHGSAILPRYLHQTWSPCQTTSVIRVMDQVATENADIQHSVDARQRVATNWKPEFHRGIICSMVSVIDETKIMLAWSSQKMWQGCGWKKFTYGGVTRTGIW